MCLNSLADDKLTASVRCIAPNGHLLEIGKYDILKGTALSMRPMHDNITFHGINLDSLFKGAQKMAVRVPPSRPSQPLNPCMRCGRPSTLRTARTLHGQRLHTPDACRYPFLAMGICGALQRAQKWRLGLLVW